jgi:hypothetical protein
MTATAQAARADLAKTATRANFPWPRRNPWRHPWILESFTWLYLIWSLVPIVLAVLFSFNNGKSQAIWQGFSWRWYFTDQLNSVAHDPVLQLAVLQTLKLSAYTTVIAIPLGVTFALGIHRWRGITSASFNFVMLLSFVIPELIFGVAMFFVFISLFADVGLGTLAETLALVTWNVSWPATGELPNPSRGSRMTCYRRARKLPTFPPIQPPTAEPATPPMAMSTGQVAAPSPNVSTAASPQRKPPAASPAAPPATPPTAVPPD